MVVVFDVNDKIKTPNETRKLEDRTLWPIELKFVHCEPALPLNARKNNPETEIVRMGTINISTRSAIVMLTEEALLRYEES